MSVKQALRDLLLSHDVAALVDGRCWQDFNTTDSSKLPYLTYQRISSPGVYHMQGDCDLAGSNYQIDVWAGTTRDRERLADLLRRNLGGFAGHVAGEDIRIQLTERGRDSTEERALNGGVKPLFRTTLEIRVWHRLAQIA